MTPSNFVQLLSTVQQAKLGITSLAVLSSIADKVVVTVSLNTSTSVTMFFINIATQFPQYSPSLDSEGSITIGNIRMAVTSTAPGRCHFSITSANQ